MPRYLVIRKFEVDEDEMPVLGRRSRQGIENQFTEITWEHSHVVVSPEGDVRTFCVYGAPHEELVREHSKRLGAHDIEALHEIAGDVTPADFPPG